MADRRGVDRVDFDQRVRIAHRHRAEAQRAAVEVERITRPAGGESRERNARRREFRRAHVDLELPARVAGDAVQPGRAVDGEIAAFGRAAVTHQPRGDAARRCPLLGACEPSALRMR